MRIFFFGETTIFFIIMYIKWQLIKKMQMENGALSKIMPQHFFLFVNKKFYAFLLNRKN